MRRLWKLGLVTSAAGFTLDFHKNPPKFTKIDENSSKFTKIHNKLVLFAEEPKPDLSKPLDLSVKRFSFFKTASNSFGLKEVLPLKL